MKERNQIRRTHQRFMRLVLVLTFAVGTLIIFHHYTLTSTYTIDSYFYLSKARQLADGQGLKTTWNDGKDTKYFPGYSIFLAFPFLFGGSYISVQLISYLLCALLLLGATKELEFDPVEQSLIATAFVANPIVIKWLSLPMAEGVALALSLLSSIFLLRFARTKSYPLLFAACMVGGIAAVTRVESLFLLAVFGVIIFPVRKGLSPAWLPAGAIVFLFPLLAYWVQLRTAASPGPAYLEEFRHTFLRFDLFKNFFYNVWVPFGFMHRIPELAWVTALAGAVWFALGEVVFVAGLACSLLGRLGARARASGLLFLAYALLHSLWYYRYERFMFMAVPLAAVVWVAAVQTIFVFVKRKKEASWRFLILAQLLIGAAGIYFGNLYSSHHRMALQQDTSWLRFQGIAEAVNALNREPRSAVLTDLGPHLAYYLDTHSYLDTEHGNYWHRAFPPERTLEEMDRLGIGFVVTERDLDEWLDEHEIPPEARHRFKRTEGLVEGALIIGYSP